MTLEEAREQVVLAAIEWRKHVVLAGPGDTFPARRPTYSGALADAVDNLRGLYDRQTA